MSTVKSKALKQAIKTEAHRLGFQLAGVTSPDPPAHFEVYQDWLNGGLHGDMAYLAAERAIQRRADPRQILPPCRSILVLGIRYPSPAREPGLDSKPSNPYRPSGQPVSRTEIPSTQFSAVLRGRTASYAWGADYHLVLVERMRSLISFIETQVGFPIINRLYTDTGPILERELAQRAGLGWIGKNACLIHPRLGSCFFIAEILLDLDLEPDAPFTADYCGNCTRCMEICPTSCILPNRTIDSRRCISYLTIEHKGIIPLELRPKIGDWVFGCDLCQQVCPWNQRFGDQPVDPSFSPFPGTPNPSLIQGLSLSHQEFNERFKGSAVKRVGRDGYLRNITVVLGNLGDPTAVPDLITAMRSDPAPLVRGHAAWALGRIGDASSRQALHAGLHLERDAYVLKEIHGALRSSR